MKDKIMLQIFGLFKQLSIYLQQTTTLQKLTIYKIKTTVIIMKKNLIALLSLALWFAPAAVQAQENGIFNHASAGVSVGDDGIGFHVAAPIGQYVQARMGYSFMPAFKYRTEVNVVDDQSKSKGKEKIEGKLNMGDFNLLFDVFPFPKSSSFHVTAGAYIGRSKVVDVYNIEPIKNAEPGDGIEIGDYFIKIDENRNANAKIKVNSFKPYVGIGFGRAVPKSRIGVLFDLGVQFWGTPKVYAYDPDAKTDVQVTSEDIGKKDGGFIKTISKIKVWPVLSLKLFGRFI